MDINMVVAMGARNRAIGMNNKLPWEDILPRRNPDMDRFKRLTEENVVVMGRHTWESLPGKYRPLPNRYNIVVSGNPDFECPDAWRADSLPAAIQHAEEIIGDSNKRLLVIGGARLYADAMKIAKYIYRTLIDVDLPGDTFFPDCNDFRVIREEIVPDFSPKLTFQTLARR